MEESSYCPVCFGITLQLHDKAIVTLVVNKLKRDNGNFVFKAGEPHTVFLQSIETKLKEFFGWYSQFKNRSVIEEVQLITSSASCRDNCKMPPDMKVNLVGVLIEKKELTTLVKKVASHYNIDTNIQFHN